MLQQPSLLCPSFSMESLEMFIVFKSNFLDRMKNCGLKGEFNVKISQNPRLEVIAENAWQADWKSLRYSKYLEHLCRDHSSSGQSNSR
jgi:hypothetical protein